MLDPADCGPAFLALPQDVQAEAFDYPARSSSRRCTTIARPRPDRGQLRRAADVAARRRAAADHRRRRRALLRRRGRAGRASPSATASRSSRRWPARRALADDHPLQRRPDRRDRLPSRERARRRGRRRARGRHPPAGLHHRLVDGVPRRPLPGSSASTPPASTPCKHRALAGASATPARRSRELGAPLGDWRGADGVDGALPRRERGARTAYIDKHRARRTDDGAADLRPGGRRGRRRRPAGRLRADGRGRLPGRAEQRLAVARPSTLRLRVRLLLHGLRDLRRVGRRDGARPTAR